MSGACKEPFERVVKGVFPFIITMIMGLFIITYWPGVSLCLDKSFITERKVFNKKGRREGHSFF